MPLKVDRRNNHLEPTGPPADLNLPDPTNLQDVRAFAATQEPFLLAVDDVARLKSGNRLLELTYTPEQRFLVRLEAGYTPDAPPAMVELSEEEMRQIGLGSAECPMCRDTKKLPQSAVGKVTGVRTFFPVPCFCVMWRLFYPRIEESPLIAREYKRVRVHNLMSYSANFRTFDRKPGQLQNLIDTVREFRFNSYLLAGPAGLGKTTLLVALYAAALKRWAKYTLKNDLPRIQAVFLANATTLSAEFRDWEMNRNRSDDDLSNPVRQPSICVPLIEAAARAGHRPAVFIEEFDKIKNSDFQLRELARIVDAVHIAGGQIVVTSNKTEYDLRKYLLEQFGGPIVRRIAGARGNTGVDEYTTDAKTGVRVQALPDTKKGGFYIDFWAGKIFQNLDWAPAAAGSTQPVPAIGVGSTDTSVQEAHGVDQPNDAQRIQPSQAAANATDEFDQDPKITTISRGARAMDPPGHTPPQKKSTKAATPATESREPVQVLTAEDVALPPPTVRFKPTREVRKRGTPSFRDFTKTT